MVHSCSAFNCTERKTKECPFTFHSFPRNELRRKEWLKAMKRENFKANEYSKICSKHFEKSCFVDKNGKAYLKSSAIPTIFGFPDNTEKLDQSASLIPLPDLTARKKRKHYIGDFKSGDLLSLKVATQLLKKAQLDLSFKNKTIRNLKARNETLSKRIEFLKGVLQNITKKCLHKESTKNVLLEVGLMAKRAILTRCGSDRKKTYAIKFNFTKGVCLNQSSQENSPNQLNKMAPCTGTPKEVCLIAQSRNLPQCSLNREESNGKKCDSGVSVNINPSSRMNSCSQSEKLASSKKVRHIAKKAIHTQYSSNEKDSRERDADLSAKTTFSNPLEKHSHSNGEVIKEVEPTAKRVVLPQCGSDRNHTCDNKFDYGGCVTLNPSSKANSSYQSNILSSKGVTKIGGMVPWGASIRDEPCPESPEKIFMEL